MTISNFLNPTEESETEEVKFNEDDLLHQLIASRTQLPIETEEEYEESETLPLIPKISEALQAVRILISCTESQDDSETSTLRLLERYERDLERKESSLTTQGTLVNLDGWLKVT